MKRVLIIQNDPPEKLGLYEEYLRKNSDLTLIRAYEMKQEDEFPRVEQYSHFIIGPTPISANDALNYEFLQKEWTYLKEIIDSGKPCLGVCCGGQILARILGGEVNRSTRKEIGAYTISLTAQGIQDQLFSGFPLTFRVFQWHSEVFTIPPGGYLLATGEPCRVQSFRKGNVWGIIFHLEITSTEAVRWAKAYPDEPSDIGKTIEQVLRECRENDLEMGRLSETLMKNFLNQ